ncbi:Hypothetical protein GLP15_3268 [Giardia lamblia P15]|uniref:Centrosomal protein of 76 kDa n=1 Tax=Giardia intestinalis (strain P15) TaxID=658858 RepID=E1EWN4_GIAIA|nr:Hypothetical protein GLP15_3268 [Giardia lamblia P15]
MDSQSIKAFVLRELTKEQLQNIFQELSESKDPELKIDRGMNPRDVEKRLLAYLERSNLVHSLTEKYFGQAFDKQTVKEAYAIHRSKCSEATAEPTDCVSMSAEERMERREQARRHLEFVQGASQPKVLSMIIHDELSSTEHQTVRAKSAIVRDSISMLTALRATKESRTLVEQHLEVQITSGELSPPCNNNLDGQFCTSEEGVITLTIVLGNLRYVYPPIKCERSDTTIGITPLAFSKVRFCISSTPLTSFRAVSDLKVTDLIFLAVFHSYSGMQYLHAHGRVGFVEFFTELTKANSPLAGAVSVPMYTYSQAPGPNTPAEKIRLGALDVSITFAPLLTSADASEEASFRSLRDVLTSSKKLVSRALAEYDRAASIFMRDYLGSQPSSVELDKRFVQLHALRDDGMVVPISTLITPFTSSYLPTASYCMRFIQLMPTPGRQSTPATVGLSEHNQLVWSRVITTLSVGAGTPFDKAVLLCSMLRGYQIPAFVALGTCALPRPRSDMPGNRSVRSAFVITLCTQVIQFWDCLLSDRGGMIEMHSLPTEGQYKIDKHLDSAGAAIHFPYETIDCIFNETMLLVNIQSTNRLQYIPEKQLIHGTSLDISKPLFWKAFNQSTIERVYNSYVYHYNIDDSDYLLTSTCLPRLLYNQDILKPFDPSLAATLSSYLTADIWRLIEARRQTIGLTTPRSDQLSMILAPTVASWEQTRLMGGTIGQLGNETLKVALKNYVSSRETLIVYPLQVMGSLRFHAPSIVETLLSNDKSRSIVEAHGDKLRIGLHISVFGYAETIAAVWVIVGCCYVPVV